MRKLGASADWSREKFTLDEDMNAAVTEAFCRFHEKGLIYKVAA
jgi:valyl-tRNA synthetase